MIVGERDDLAFRNECVVSLQRVHGTLCDWGTKGQADWYFRLLMDCPAAQSNIYSQSSLAAAGEAAARGSDLHFAGQRAFWQDVEFEVVTNGYALGDPARGVRRNHDQTLKLLEKPPSLVPKLPPMK